MYRCDLTTYNYDAVEALKTNQKHDEIATEKCIGDKDHAWIEGEWMTARPNICNRCGCVRTKRATPLVAAVDNGKEGHMTWEQVEAGMAETLEQWWGMICFDEPEMVRRRELDREFEMLEKEMMTA